MTSKEVLENLYQVVAPEYREAVAEGIKALEHFKKGKFEYDEEVAEYRCSECGHLTASEVDLEDEKVDVEGLGRVWAVRKPHYCKHCGAYMREEEDGG